MTVGGMNFTQGRGDHFDMRMFFGHIIHHAEKCGWIQFGRRFSRRSWNPETELQIFFVPDQHIHILDNLIEHRHGTVMASNNIPKLSPIIQIE